MRYTDVWNDLTKKLDWVDLKILTLPKTKIHGNSLVAFKKTIVQQSSLYKGYTIQPYSPKAGTGLSSHELNQPGTYRDVSDTTLSLSLKLKKILRKSRI